MVLTVMWDIGRCGKLFKINMAMLLKGTLYTVDYASLYFYFFYQRSTVMMVMKILNPDGVERRRRNRLKRRVYQNKASIRSLFLLISHNKEPLPADINKAVFYV